MAADWLDATRAAGALIDARRAGRTVACITALSGNTAGGRVLVYGDGSMLGSFGEPQLDAAARRIGAESLQSALPVLLESPHLFAEPQLAEAQLIIVGAGHISVPLARIGRMIGFRVTVLDDRDEFATGARFDDDVVVRQLDFARPFDSIELNERSHVVLVTRAHRLDYDCLRVLLTSGQRPHYIGMIGSRRRVRAAFHALLEAGVAASDLEAIHAPVGLDIGAETPAEIAVSIAAELIRLRSATGSAVPLADRERVLERFFAQEQHG